jgi:hypothetical protein
MCLEIISDSTVPYLAPPPPLPKHLGNRNVQHPTMNSEADRRKTYEKRPVPFTNTNSLAAAGFNYTNWGDVVRSAFCGVEVGLWEEGVEPSKIISVGDPLWIR